MESGLTLRAASSLSMFPGYDLALLFIALLALRWIVVMACPAPCFSGLRKVETK